MPTAKYIYCPQQKSMSPYHLYCVLFLTTNEHIGMHQCVVIYDDAIIINYCKITIIYCLKQVLQLFIG